jgi:hypothetical protein
MLGGSVDNKRRYSVYPGICDLCIYLFFPIIIYKTTTITGVFAMTILYEADWGKYPSAIIDTKTTNTSFLRLASVYNRMSVKNNAFHLSLLQPKLQGVNPFDPDLDEETQLMIALECRWNLWYCLREIIHLPPQGGPSPIRYKANRGNIALSWAFMNHIDFALIQPRQTGKSGSTDSLWITVMNLMATHTTIQLLTNNDKVRKSNIDRLKGIRNELPQYLNPISNMDSDNKEGLTCLARNNIYKTAIGRTDRTAADGVGRGLTSPILHSDETPYTPNIQISLPVALSSGTAARENARAAGGLYCNVFTTTAGKKDSKEGKFAYNLIHNGMYWNERLLDCRDREELENVILKNSHGDKPMINGTFSHRQLGYTDGWLKDAINNSRSSEDLANRDYLNIWTSGTESSPLTIAINEAIHRSEIDPMYTEMTKDGYQLRWYLPKEDILKVLNDDPHLITLDSSNAVGKDANGLTFINATDMSITATSNVSEANLFRYAKWITDLLIMYPKTIFVIENKSSAQGIIDVLLTILPKHGIDPFKRIYNRLVENSEKYAEAFAELKRPVHSRKEEFYLKNKGLFGFMTSGNSRSFLYDTVLQQAAKMSAHLIRDRVLSSEIRGLIMVNGRVDHPAGAHDDLTISWLLGHYFVSHSKGLKHYDIDLSLVLSRAIDDSAEISEIDAEKRARVAKLRLEVESLKRMLKTAITPIEGNRIECLLRQRVSTLELETGQSINLDSIINEAKEIKNKSTSLRDAIKRYAISR